MRAFRFLAVLAISSLFAPAALALTGKVREVPEDDQASIAWDERGAEPAPGRLGLVTDGEINLALFRISGSEKSAGTVEIVDSVLPRVVTAGMHARLLDVTPPPPPKGWASFFVWSLRSGRSILLDGAPAGETPVRLLLTPGTHQILLELPTGGRAGAEVEARPGDSRFLLLNGKLPATQNGTGPAYFHNPYRGGGSKPPLPPPSLLWLEDDRGERIYLECERVQKPAIVNKVQPSYLESARKARVQGPVWLYALLGTDGRPTDVQVIAAPSPDLGTAALDALRQWTYQPSTLDGKPVRMLLRLCVEFYLAR